MTNNLLVADTFNNSNEMAELGAKVSLFDGKAFAGAALYTQKRNRQNVRFILA